MKLCTDPKIRERLENHSVRNGRMSRQDILSIMQSEVSGE